MLIEEIIFELGFKNNGFKYINNYILDEVYENLYSCKNINQELYDKIVGLLHANLAIVESIEKTLSTYQNKVDEHYTELAKAEA